MSEQMKIDNVELGKVKPSKTNPRKNFDESEMVELTESVRFKGILQPLLVRPDWCIGKSDEQIEQINGDAEAGFFEIVAGERRFRAAERAKLPTLPLIVRPLSDQETLEIQLIENLQREDLDPFEEAEGYHRLLALRDGHGEPVHTVETIHKRVGKSRKRIYYRLKLLGVPKEIQDAVRGGTLATAIAEEIGGIPTLGLRQAAAEEILHPAREEGPLNARKARELLSDRYMRSLAGAQFDQEDAQLVPIMTDEESGERIGGGACADCPMRTGNMEAIIGKTKRPDVCTNPKCYLTKCDAQFARLQTEAVKEGKRIISEAEAKEIFEEDGSVYFDSPFVKLTERPDPHECPGLLPGNKAPTWATLFKGLPETQTVKVPSKDQKSGITTMVEVTALFKKPTIYVAKDPRNRIVELVDRKLAIEAIKLAAKQKGESSIFDELKSGGRPASTQGSGATIGQEANWKIEDRKKREKAKFDLRVTLASLQGLYAEISAKGGVDGYWEALVRLSILHASHDGCWLVCKWLKLEPKKDKRNPNAKDYAGAIEKYAKKLTRMELGALATCLLLSPRVKFNGVKDTEFKRFAVVFKIDISEIERSLKANPPSGNQPARKATARREVKADASDKSAQKNLSGGARAERAAENSTGPTGSAVFTGGSTPPVQKFKTHKFEKIADNKYRCKNCGAFAVKHNGKMLAAKEFRGKPCLEWKDKNGGALKRGKKKAKVKRR